MLQFVQREFRDAIFDPYPSIMDPDKPHLLALDPKCKNVTSGNYYFTRGYYEG